MSQGGYEAGGTTGNRIPYEARAQVYNVAINTYGREAQSWMVVEEAAEMMKELCKMQRGKGDKEALADEIADITIMLEQLRMMYEVNEAVCRHMDMKVERLARRLGIEVETNEQGERKL